MIVFDFFSGNLIDTGSSSSATTIGGPVAGSDPNSVLIVDSSNNLADIPLSNGQLVIGATGAVPTAGTLTGTTNQVNVTNGANSITLSLPQSIATTSSPQFANVVLTPSGSVDITGAGGTLAIGTANADTINIGNSGATINIQGDTFYQNVTELQVADKRIGLNIGGSAGSASNSGIEIEENSIITAYVDTTSDRNGWELKAPNQTGIATINPGSSGFTIDQGSHDPLTIGTANGLSLSTQQLSLGLSSTSTTGALSSTDWNTFNGKQDAGNYITALTGDATASGPGSATLTFATVNSNVGTFNNLTVNAKGLVTAGSTVAYLTGNQTITLSGDTTGSGTTAITTTLATVNSNVGSFGTASSVGTFTVNGKGLVTAASSTSIQIAESQVTNLTTDLATKVDKVTADIVPTTWSSLANNTANQVITGFVFANSVKSFEALVDIEIVATANTYTTVKLLGKNKSADWSSSAVSTDVIGDVITGIAFDINGSGNVVVSIGSITGFSSGIVKFRAITLS